MVLICTPSTLVEFYGKDVWYLGNTMCEYHGWCGYCDVLGEFFISCCFWYQGT